MFNENGTDSEKWSFVQVKGKLNEADVIEADIITCVVFNKDGNLLATGDRGGRVVVFQRNLIGSGCYNDEYNVYATFQSHEADFDYLKSLDIEEKINKICWLNSCNNSHFMLTTNDKTIKLFKVCDRVKRRSSSQQLSRRSSVQESSDDGPFLNHEDQVEKPQYARKVPRTSYVRDGTCKRLYSNAHSYNIHSITSCCDGEHFLSADDLRINLWNIERNDTCFNIVDIKPDNLEELAEVITACEFHHFENSLFMYSSSRGITRLCDTRISSNCDMPAAVFDNPEDEDSVSRFSEVVRSIYDVKFSSDPRYFATRDFLSVKVWDLNMPTVPVETYVVHEYLNYDAKLSELYENECIFDKFEVQWSSKGNSLITGTYGNNFSVIDRAKGYHSEPRFFYEANSDLVLASQAGNSILTPKMFMDHEGKYESIKDNESQEFVNPEDLDFSCRISNLDWNPTSEIIAMAATNNLYIFSKNDL